MSFADCARELAAIAGGDKLAAVNAWWRKWIVAGHCVNTIEPADLLFGGGKFEHHLVREMRLGLIGSSPFEFEKTNAPDGAVELRVEMMVIDPNQPPEGQARA